MLDSHRLFFSAQIWDMFGCGIPVCAVAFRCLHELVHHGKNGYIFENSAQLARQLGSIFKDFPHSGELATLAKGVSTTRLHENWIENALPTLQAQVQIPKRRSTVGIIVSLLAITAAVCSARSHLGFRDA